MKCQQRMIKGVAESFWSHTELEALGGWQGGGDDPAHLGLAHMEALLRPDRRQTQGLI